MEKKNTYLYFKYSEILFKVFWPAQKPVQQFISFDYSYLCSKAKEAINFCCWMMQS